MGTDVIERVNDIGRSQGQALVAKKIKYQWGPNEDEIEYDNDSDDNSEDQDVANMDAQPLSELLNVEKNEEIDSDDDSVAIDKDSGDENEDKESGAPNSVARPRDPSFEEELLEEGQADNAVINEEQEETVVPDEVLMEEGAENACNDLAADDAEGITSENIFFDPIYRSRSGRAKKAQL